MTESPTLHEANGGETTPNPEQPSSKILNTQTLLLLAVLALIGRDVFSHRKLSAQLAAQETALQQALRTTDIASNRQRTQMLAELAELRARISHPTADNNKGDLSEDDLSKLNIEDSATGEKRAGPSAIGSDDRLSAAEIDAQEKRDQETIKKIKRLLGILELVSAKELKEAMSKKIKELQAIKEPSKSESAELTELQELQKLLNEAYMGKVLRSATLQGNVSQPIHGDERRVFPPPTGRTEDCKDIKKVIDKFRIGAKKPRAN